MLGEAAVTTVILTFNEEIHIDRAIKCANTFSSEVIVVDSYSTDRTVELAIGLGARVLQNPFVSHARQLNWALDHGEIKTPWTLRLDADEIIGPDLAARIRDELDSVADDVEGILFNRRHVFMNRWVRRGGRYPLYMLRLWRTHRGRAEDRWMDEHVVLDSDARTVAWEGEFADVNERNLTYFIRKHDSYASREAVERLDKHYGFLERPEHAVSVTGRQAKIKRLIKDRLYNSLPFGAGPTLYFLYRLIVQRGFLDGRTGFIYHALQGFWYRLLVEAKIIEFDRILARTSAAERRATLEYVSGVKLPARNPSL
jgi:glycosyltransferase involved in cell wall biosynthesis